MLGQMVTALKPPQVATTALCEAKAVSISRVYPVINGLMKKHLVIADGDLHAVKVFKRTVVAEIQDCFKPESPDIADAAPVLAAALDPHYHQLKFLSAAQRSIAYTALKEKVKKLKMVQSQLEKEQTQQCDAQTTGMKQMTALSFLLEDEDSEESANDEEVDKYLAETPLKCDDNCLEWWK